MPQNWSRLRYHDNSGLLDANRSRPLSEDEEAELNETLAVEQFIRLHRLGPSFHYLTGTRPQLRRVWKQYGILVKPGALETVDHAAYEMLVEPNGRAKLIWSPKATTADVVHDVKLLA